MSKLNSKAWFPYDRPDRPDHPNHFKMFQDDLDDWGDWQFPYDRLDRLKARDVGSSVMSLGQKIEFLRMFCKQAT